jgi:hypothetical protein
MINLNFQEKVKLLIFYKLQILRLQKILSIQKIKIGIKNSLPILRGKTPENTKKFQ